jgi:purine-binding chemotaxis protein CheW
MSGAHGRPAVAEEMVSLCSFCSGSGLYGIDTREIREVFGAVAPQRVPLAPEYIGGVLPYRGEVLTTVSLRVLLGLERDSGKRCALVLDDGNEERFGLMVDEVGGVVTVPRRALEANPSALDARSRALFGGFYRLPTGLMVRLEPQGLRPSRLMESGLPEALNERTGEHRCER